MAQRNQILFHVFTRMTSKLQVMDFKIGHGSAELTAPAVSLTCIFDLPDGRAGFKCDVQMLALQSLCVVDCDLHVVWDNEIVLESFDDKQTMWRLGHDEFVPNQVLNNRIEQGLYLRSRKPVAGVILATGLKAIPSEYRMGSRVALAMSLYDAAWPPMHFDFCVSIRRVQYGMREYMRRSTPDRSAPTARAEVPNSSALCCQTEMTAKHHSSPTTPQVKPVSDPNGFERNDLRLK